MQSIIDFKLHTGFELPGFAHEYILKLMNDLKTHDVGTFEHCERVSNMCLDLAQNLELDLLEQALCLYSGLLHDVGKLKVPTDIINKPSKLTSDEFSIMKKHTEFGVELLEPLGQLPFFEMMRNAILYHHERVDGKGYHQLPESRIPQTSKIILITDTVDAMSADRPYRKGLPLDVVVNELITCSGTQFEANYVNVFLDSLSRRQKKAA